MHTASTVIYTLIFVILATIVGGIFFIYSGAFDVSARWKDGPLVHWIVKTTRQRSVAARAAGIKVPADLDNPDVIMTGFKHYREMCVGCHRAPGLDPSEISRGLNPSPPDFSRWKHMGISSEKLFWIIKNGIRMTAMPAWGVTHSDDKIWAMVAFVRKLPGMSPAEYKAMDHKAGPEGEDEDHHHDEAGAGGHEHGGGHEANHDHAP